MQQRRLGFERALLQIGIFSFFVNVLLLTMPLYMLQIYDRVLPSSSADTLIYLSVFAGGALLLLGALETVRSIIAARLAARFDVANSQRAFEATLSSPKSHIGDIQPMRDLSAMRSFISSRAMFSLFDLPFAPLFILLLWFLHPLLFWMTAIGAVLLLFVAVLNQWVTARGAKAAAEHNLAEMATAQSFVRNAEALRAMGMTENAVTEWARHHVPALDKSDRVAGMNAFFTGLSKFVRMALQISVLGIGAGLVLTGNMTAGMIFAASIIAGRGLQPLDQIIGGWRQFVEVNAARKRFVAATKSVQSDRQYTDLPAPKGQLTIEHLVYFAPNADRHNDPVLKRISFGVPAGGVVGIVGPSGAGKSTLARLIVGAIQPTSGSVRIDGADIKNWNPEILGRYIGYLPQEVDILPGTISQNIARFDEAANDADIVAAANRAQAHELIQSLPQGYDTLIGPSGVSLSGGQRQRIGLARAFYGEPVMLVLDEPNSNLDNEGEIALEKAISTAREKGTTILVITQRKAVARAVESLLVLRGGAIEDYGPRDEVIAQQQEKYAPGAQTSRAAKPDTNTSLRIADAANANSDADKKPQSDADASAPEKPKSPFAAFGPGLRPLSRGEEGR
jgi:PrtD family type I secretion system ABC transporter